MKLGWGWSVNWQSKFGTNILRFKVPGRPRPPGHGFRR